MTLLVMVALKTQPVIASLCDLSDKDFREEMERTASKTQEDMRVKMRKPQAEETEFKNLIGEMKDSLEGLDRATVAEEKISELQDNIRKTSREQHKWWGKGGPSE